MTLTALKPRLSPYKPTPIRQNPPIENWGKGRGGRPWRRLRAQILARDNYTCKHCGRIGGKLELDHIINLANGGTDDPSNLQTLCHTCHTQKTHTEKSQKTTPHHSNPQGTPKLLTA